MSFIWTNRQTDDLYTRKKKKDILIYLVAINALSVILNGLYYITALKTKPKKDYRQLVGTLFRK